MSWMAPELLTGRYQHNSKTDVYALAMTLYEIAFGVRPFASIPQDVIPNIVGRGQRPTLDLADYNGDVQQELFPGTMPPQALIALIGECWDQDRDKRPDIDVIVDRVEAMKTDECAARAFMLRLLDSRDQL